MNLLPATVTLSRWQFAFTAMFHILFPVLIIGLSWFLVLMEALWVTTKAERYYRQARFWSRLFFLNLAMGVVSGIPLEFQFGTNWDRFSSAGGDIFGHMLGFEAAMAFMLEATFFGIMAFGWKRVSSRVHLFATTMVAVGASLSAFWIMVANSWMQIPVGGYFENGRFIMTDSLQAVFNPDIYWSFTHMWVACLEVSACVLGGISAWHLLKQRHVSFFSSTFKIAFVVAAVTAPLQIYLGDGSGRVVFDTQPTKLAAIESHWETNPPGKGAGWKILAYPDPAAGKNRWQVEIPNALSLLMTHSLTGQITGLNEFSPDKQPPVALVFYAFRLMLLFGFVLFFIMIWTGVAWHKKRWLNNALIGKKKLLVAWILAAPMSYLAMEAGWVTREAGRQPWIIYGVLRTSEAATQLPAGTVGGSLTVFILIYGALFFAFLRLAGGLLRKGPEPENGEATY